MLNNYEEIIEELKKIVKQKVLNILSKRDCFKYITSSRWSFNCRRGLQSNKKRLSKLKCWNCKLFIEL